MRLLHLLIISLLFSTMVIAQQVPFQLEIEPVTATAVPPIHSFAFAKSGSKWLIVGGRTNGLHGFSSNDNFAVEYANSDVVVVDTTTWNYYTSSIQGLPIQVKDPLRATNMQYTVIGDYLYLAGGFGWDSTLNRYDTYSVLTAIHIDSMINAVMNGAPIAPHIRQVTDTNVRVCGGEFITIGDTSYLIFGHYFRGRYTQVAGPTFVQRYVNEVRKFVIQDDGVSISLNLVGVVSDTTNFHRRDLTVSGAIDPFGNETWTAFSGVFRKDTDLPYLSPITYSPTAGFTVASSFEQRMNNYTCPAIPIYDSVQGTMYTVLMGGCSMYDFDPATSNLTLDSLVPFVADISVMIQDASGQWAQVPLLLQFPKLLGSNMKFVPLDSIPMYTNEVIRLRDVQNRILVGYLYGGIEAAGPNLQTSIANDTIFRVYLTPDLGLLNVTDNPSHPINIFPVPANDKLMVNVQNSGSTTIELRNSLGQIIFTGVQQGAGTTAIPVLGLAAGTYSLRISFSGETTIVPVSIVH